MSCKLMLNEGPENLIKFRISTECIYSPFRGPLLNIKLQDQKSGAKNTTEADCALKGLAKAKSVNKQVLC